MPPREYTNPLLNWQIEEGQSQDQIIRAMSDKISLYFDYQEVPWESRPALLQRWRAENLESGADNSKLTIELAFVEELKRFLEPVAPPQAQEARPLVSHKDGPIR